MAWAVKLRILRNQHGRGTLPSSSMLVVYDPHIPLLFIRATHSCCPIQASEAHTVVLASTETELRSKRSELSEVRVAHLSLLLLATRGLVGSSSQLQRAIPVS